MATAAITPPAAGTTLPTAPSTADPANFDARADAFFAALPGLQTSENLLKDNVYANAVVAYNNAVQTATDSAAASAAAALAAAYAGAALWVSGTTYVAGDTRSSPANNRAYTRLTNGAGTTDPSIDTTNWVLTPNAVPFLHVTGLVQLMASGCAYSLENTTAQAAATNLCLYSSQHDNAAWVKSNVTVTADFTMSPTGDINADKIVESATTATHFTKQLVTQAANVNLTYSIEVKAAGRTSVRLSMDRDDGYADGCYADFNLTTGVASNATNMGTGSGATATMTFLGDGWYLCTLSGKPSTTAGTQVGCRNWLQTGNSYAGDGVSGVSVAEAQLEAGLAATSRIATGAAQASRASNVIAPSRAILPASPTNDMWAKIVVSNGIDTNVIDPNGSSIMGVTGPMKIDNAAPPAIVLQYVVNTWRLA